jgi:hypothetical protein
VKPFHGYFVVKMVFPLHRPDAFSGKTVEPDLKKSDDILHKPFGALSHPPYCAGEELIVRLRLSHPNTEAQHDFKDTQIYFSVDRHRAGRLRNFSLFHIE